MVSLPRLLRVSQFLLLLRFELSQSKFRGRHSLARHDMTASATIAANAPQKAKPGFSKTRVYVSLTSAAYLDELSMIRSQLGARCVQPGTFCDQLNPTRDPFESSLGNNFEPLAVLVHTTLVPRPSHPFQSPFSLFPFNLPPFSQIPLPYFLARRNARSD